jgi:drug/metabolite transporter (DMT)-like permease
MNRRAAVLGGLGALLLSFAAVFVRLADGAMGPTALAAWRMTLAAAALFGLARLAGARLRLPPRRLAFAAAAGIVFALDLFLWHRSILLVGAGLATVLASTQIFWSTAADRSKGWFSVALAFAGVALASGCGVASVSAWGVALGLGAGVAYGVYLLVLKRAGTGSMSDSVATLAWVCLFGGAALFAACGVEGVSVRPAGLRVLAAVAGLALLVQVAGWMAISRALAKAPASLAGLLLLLQPALATAWGILFFGESFTAIQVAGGLLLLTGIYVRLAAPRVPAAPPLPAGVPGAPSATP